MDKPVLWTSGRFWLVFSKFFLEWMLSVSILMSSLRHETCKVFLATGACFQESHVKISFLQNSGFEDSRGRQKRLAEVSGNFQSFSRGWLQGWMLSQTGSSL